MKTPRPRATRTTRRAAARIAPAPPSSESTRRVLPRRRSRPPRRLDRRSPSLPPSSSPSLPARSRVAGALRFDARRRRSRPCPRRFVTRDSLCTPPEPFSTWARRVRPRPSPSPCARVSRTGRDRGPGPTVRGGASRRRLARPRRRAPRSPRPPSRFRATPPSRGRARR